MDLVCTIDVEMLKKAEERGHCLCEVQRKEDQSNVCPCTDFLKGGNCKCGVYSDCRPADKLGYEK